MRKSIGSNREVENHACRPAVWCMGVFLKRGWRAAGLMARSVGDVKLLDTVLNSCSRKDRNITLKGLRLGYPVNWWQDIGQEV